MKLTSSGNVMLVTFSFSRQRDGAIFKAYFQAVPKAGSSALTEMSTQYMIHAEALLCILCTNLSPPAGCGGSISSWNGSIASPYYTSYYPPNIDCTWIIQVSHMTACTTFVHIPSCVFSCIWLLYQAPLPGYLISMTIVKMDIQDSPSSDSCEKDWLNIGGVK